jgi:hypothetical protein
MNEDRDPHMLWAALFCNLMIWLVILFVIFGDTKP